MVCREGIGSEETLLRKKYVDTCATIQRCAEEKQMLPCEAEDAVRFYAHSMAQIEQAISALSGFPLNSVEYGLQTLLERELAIARSLHGRMSDALAKIRLVFGLPPLVVDAVPTATIWDCEEESVRCADPDEIPAAEDEGSEGSSNGGSSDTGYGSGGSDSDSQADSSESEASDCESGSGDEL